MYNFHNRYLESYYITIELIVTDCNNILFMKLSLKSLTKLETNIPPILYIS